MAPVAAAAPAPSTEPGPEPAYGRWRLLAGLIGRGWLWFVVGCLLVTFVPMLFGWRPYVVESGSMAPRIKVGDVVLASPEHDVQRLLGHVAVFDDPDHPGRVKSHRVVKVNPDGTLVTKGDANPTADSSPVQVSAVRGLGRLLVRWVGLPLIWVSLGQWVKLLLLLASLLLAGLAVARDHEEDDDDADPDDGPPPGALPVTACRRAVRRHAHADRGLATVPAARPSRAVRRAPGACPVRDAVRPGGPRRVDADPADDVRGVRRHDHQRHRELERAQLGLHHPGQRAGPVPVLEARRDRDDDHDSRRQLR